MNLRGKTSLPSLKVPVERRLNEGNGLRREKLKSLAGEPIYWVFDEKGKKTL